MHLRFIAVLTEVFGYIVLVCVKFCHYYNLAKGLQQDAKEGAYGDNFFQGRGLLPEQSYRILLIIP
jgi:hypothetical protein